MSLFSHVNQKLSLQPQERTKVYNFLKDPNNLGREHISKKYQINLIKGRLPSTPNDLMFLLHISTSTNNKTELLN